MCDQFNGSKWSLVPTDTRISFKAFRNYRLPRQLVAFQKRFRLLELPLPEIRPEFGRNTSNGGMPQSGMPRLARCQEFHRLSMRRHRVLSRQSGVLKPKNPGPNPPSLLRLIFSPVAFVFSFYIPVVELAARAARCSSSRASSTYKGMRKPEFQKIGRIEVIKEAEALAERSEGRWWCAELHRLRGVFLTALGADEPQIEASFCEAIRIAKKQKSISMAKRAEGTYAEYRRQKVSTSGGRGFRLPLC